MSENDPLKKIGDTAKDLDLLAALTDILHELKKQDAAAVNDEKSQQTMIALLTNMAEIQPQILEQLATIAELQKPPNIFKRAASGTVKAAGLAAIISGSIYFNDADNRNDALNRGQTFIQDNILPHFEQ